MVALGAGQPEDAFLEDGVGAVPEGERQAEDLRSVADPAEAVLTPPKGSGASVVVRHVIPGVAMLAVVLTNRAPGPLAQARTPGLQSGIRSRKPLPFLAGAYR